MEDKMIKNIQRTFELYGLNITRNVSKGLWAYLREIDEGNRNDELSKLVEQILLTQKLTSPNVDPESIRIAIKECNRSTNTLREEETVLNIIDNDNVPKVKYDITKTKFILTKVDTELLPDAIYKPLVYKDRINLLWHRTLKHELFQPPKLGEVNPNKRKLTPIEYLNSNSVNGNVTILGMLTLMTETQFYLEDTTGYVKLNFNDTKFDSGIIVQGAIVIIEGDYDDEVFTAKNVCLPPPDIRNNENAIFGEANTFGGPSSLSLKFSKNLLKIEHMNEDGMILFISDFWVNDFQVTKKFNTLLEGYSDYPPIAIVLCGHFISGFQDYKTVHKLEEGFRALADIVERYPNIVQNTKFIFIPGPYDVGGPKILPRASIPKYCMNYFISKVPNTILAPNPCRLQYCTKEIIIIRENLLTKLCRNTLHFSKDGDIQKHFAQTIISQAHLTPCTLPMIPIHWKYDHVLQLFPTPDLIVVCDKFKPYISNYNDCYVINPGSFLNSGFSFLSYLPAKNNVEECIIEDD